MRRETDQAALPAHALSILSAFSPPTGRETDQVWLDRVLGGLAGAQHGVVAWFQLRALGVHRGRVDRLLQRGRLHRIHRGVYAVGHRVLSVSGRRLAAALALGPTAAISHRTAALHWDLLSGVGGAIHLTLPDRVTRSRRRGLVLHRAPDAELTVHDGVPVTTVAWTLLDLAATARRDVLEQALQGAERSRLFDRGAIEPLLLTSRPGARILRSAMELYDDAPTNRELERRFLVLCREHDLPRPKVNEMVEGFPADFHWPEYRLIVETDGGWHDTRRGRREDGDRDAAHALAGWRTQRISWVQVVHRPAETAALVRTLLAAQSALLHR